MVLSSHAPLALSSQKNRPTCLYFLSPFIHRKCHFQLLFFVCLDCPADLFVARSLCLQTELSCPSLYFHLFLRRLYSRTFSGRYSMDEKPCGLPLSLSGSGRTRHAGFLCGRHALLAIQCLIRRFYHSSAQPDRHDLYRIHVTVLFIPVGMPVPFAGMAAPFYATRQCFLSDVFSTPRMVKYRSGLLTSSSPCSRCGLYTVSISFCNTDVLTIFATHTKNLLTVLVANLLRYKIISVRPNRFSHRKNAPCGGSNRRRRSFYNKYIEECLYDFIFLGNQLFFFQ